jgi:hypothetical protein
MTYDQGLISTGSAAMLRAISLRAKAPKRHRAGVRRLSGAAALACAFAVAWTWLSPGQREPLVHPDRSRVETGVRAQIARDVLVSYRDGEGRIRQALADPQAVSAFVRRESHALEQARLQALGRAEAALARSARPVFDDMRKRVTDLSDWYLAWGTSHRLAGRAALSALGNMIDPRVDDLAAAVSADVERYVETRYRSLVLRPEHTDPALAEGFNEALAILHAGFAEAVGAFDRQLRAFVAVNTTHLRPDAADGARLLLDWDAQGARLSLAGHERGALETGRGFALALAGATTGRSVGGLLAGASSARLGAISGTSLAARLAGPHVSRGLAAAGGAGAGAVGGALGFAAGAALGVGADWLINAAVGAVRRPRFERDVRDLVTLHEHQWHQAMHEALDASSRAWFGDLTELVARAGEGR